MYSCMNRVHYMQQSLSRFVMQFGEMNNWLLADERQGQCNRVLLVLHRTCSDVDLDLCIV